MKLTLKNLTMKKTLTIAFLFFGLLGSAQNLVVNGDIIKSDPTYSGTLRIYNPALNQINFSHSMFGDFLIVGSGNGWNSGSYSIASRIRGAAFSSSTANVPALQTEYGINRFNLYDGRSLFGQNVPDDGFSLVQVHGGLKTDTLRVGSAGAPGDVLTKQADGTYKPQTPAGGGGTWGVFTPTMNLILNLGSLSQTFSNACNYTVQGKIVTVTYSGQGVPVSANSLCTFTLTLPPGYSTWNGAPNYAAVMVGMNQSTEKMGMAWMSGQNQITVSFTNTTASVAYAFGFTMQYSTL